MPLYFIISISLVHCTWKEEVGYTLPVHFIRNKWKCIRGYLGHTWDMHGHLFSLISSFKSLIEGRNPMILPQLDLLIEYWETANWWGQKIFIGFSPVFLCLFFFFSLNHLYVIYLDGWDHPSRPHHELSSVGFLTSNQDALLFLLQYSNLGPSQPNK